MKRLQIFFISIFLTISISLFSSASGKTVESTVPLQNLFSYIF
jgi:hypothetical protein